jgi:ethanolamine utilization protein EutN
MQLAIVIGHATATIKHPSFEGWRLVVAQPLNVRREPEADPVVAIDKFNSAAGQIVLLNSDGRGAREYIGDEHSPARYFVAGIVDDVKAQPSGDAQPSREAHAK